MLVKPESINTTTAFECTYANMLLTKSIEN